MPHRTLVAGGLVAACIVLILAACQATPAPGASDAADAKATAAPSTTESAMTGEVKTMFVAPETKDCTGVGPMKSGDKISIEISGIGTLENPVQ